MSGYFRRRVLSFAEIDAHCATLSEMARDFAPEHIVSIRSGGWYIGKKVAENLGCPHLQITIRREVGSDFDAAPKWRLIARLLLEDLRRIAMDPMVLSGLSEQEDATIKGKKVLVIDDAVDTGKTLIVARRYFSDSQRKPGKLKTLTLVNMRGVQGIDYSLLKGMHCYPWSRISSEYSRFLEMLPKQGESFCLPDHS